jgi:hypothetical protein
MAELADAMDSKSIVRKGVWVQVPLRARIDSVLADFLKPAFSFRVAHENALTGRSPLYIRTRLRQWGPRSADRGVC